MLRSRSFLYSLLSIALLILGWAWYGANAWQLLIAFLSYALLVVLPGYAFASVTLKRSSGLEAIVIGTIVSEIALGIILKLTGGSELSTLILFILAWVSLRKKEKVQIVTQPLLQPALIGLTVLAFLLFFLYGQAHRGEAHYIFHYNPTVDLTYFQTVLTSIGNYDEFKDLAHLGVHFNYPDLGYQVLSLLQRASGAEAFDILFFFAPLKDYLLLSLCVYCLVRRYASPWLAFIAAISFYVFGSRSILELNVPMTNPAYREGLYIFVMGLWSYSTLERWPRIFFFTIAIIGLVLVKPAIWLVAAPALLIGSVFSAWRSRSVKPLYLTASVVVASAAIFYFSFAPGQSGLSSGHYEIIFGQGLAGTIDSVSKIGLGNLFRDIVQPLSQLTFWSVVGGFLLFTPFLIQQFRHSGRLILLPFVLVKHWRSVRELDFQLLGIVLSSFAYLAFAGMEYTSFLHVYLVPLAVTAATIYLAITGTWGVKAGWKGKVLTLGTIALLVYDIGFAAYGYHQERVKTAAVEIPVALIDEFREVRGLTDTGSTLATYRTGLFQPADERSYLAAAFTERKILSEGAIYGSLIMGYQENIRDGHRSVTIDTLQTRRAARDSIFFSSSPKMVLHSARRYGVTHILIQHGTGERIHASVGDTIFHGEMLTLLKL